VSLSSLDLNLLLVLDTVLAERSVARAAKRLHLTPSAISNALARLRVALGDPLVVRSGRGIVPTPRAVELAPALARALSDLERAVARSVFDPKATARTFTLAIADSGQIVRLPKLASLFSNAMPRAKLRVVGIDTLVSSGGLAGTLVDAAIAAMPDAPPGLRQLPLFDELAILVASRRHPRIRDRVSKSELSSLRHVDVEVLPGRGYRDLPVHYERLGIERDVVLTVPSFATAAAIVAATDFVATLPVSLVETIGKRLGIRAVPSPVRGITVGLKLAWHERTEDDPAMRLFRSVILQLATD
jgi:DNA-binding transcriptional LysR family regulator